MKKILFTLLIVLPFAFAFSQTEKLDKFPVDVQDSRSFTARQVSEMAIFPGCEEVTEKSLLTKCFARKMNELLVGKLEDFAQEMENLKISTAHTKLQFVVDKKGKLTQIKAMEGGTPILGEASLKAMNEIATEIKPIRPALLEDGSPVNLVFQLPVRYQIELSETAREPEYEWDELVMATLKDESVRYEIRIAKTQTFKVYEVVQSGEIFLGNYSSIAEIVRTEPYRSILEKSDEKFLVTEGFKDEVEYKFYNLKSDPTYIYVYQIKNGEENLLEKLEQKEFYLISKYSEFFVR